MGRYVGNERPYAVYRGIPGKPYILVNADPATDVKISNSYEELSNVAVGVLPDGGILLAHGGGALQWTAGKTGTIYARAAAVTSDIEVL